MLQGSAGLHCRATFLALLPSKFLPRWHPLIVFHLRMQNAAWNWKNLHHNALVWMGQWRTHTQTHSYAFPHALGFQSLAAALGFRPLLYTWWKWPSTGLHSWFLGWTSFCCLSRLRDTGSTICFSVYNRMFTKQEDILKKIRLCAAACRGIVRTHTLNLYL